MAPKKRKSEEKKQEKTKEGKQSKPVRERAKGIVIKGVVPANSETESNSADFTAKKGTKRKRQYVVKSKYSLRSGLKGLGADAAAEKGKEKISEVSQESETDPSEVCKRAKKDDVKDDSDDRDGDRSERYKSKGPLGLKLDLAQAVKDIAAGRISFK